MGLGGSLCAANSGVSYTLSWATPSSYSTVPIPSGLGAPFVTQQPAVPMAPAGRSTGTGLVEQRWLYFAQLALKDGVGTFRTQQAGCLVRQLGVCEAGHPLQCVCPCWCVLDVPRTDTPCRGTVLGPAARPCPVPVPLCWCQAALPTALRVLSWLASC